MWSTLANRTYGLGTDRSARIPHFAQPGGHGFCWAGAEVNLRGMCYEHGTLPIDLGWYAPRIGPRTRQFNNVDLILELKPILERGLRPGVTER